MLSERQNLQCDVFYPYTNAHCVKHAVGKLKEHTKDNMKRFTLMTWLFMAMCKLGRCRIGRKNAFAVEHLFKSK